MKKLLILVLAMTLIACGESEEEKRQKEAERVNQQVSELNAKSEQLQAQIAEVEIEKQRMLQDQQALAMQQQQMQANMQQVEAQQQMMAQQPAPVQQPVYAPQPAYIPMPTQVAAPAHQGSSMVETGVAAAAGAVVGNMLANGMHSSSFDNNGYSARRIDREYDPNTGNYRSNYYPGSNQPSKQIIINKTYNTQPVAPAVKPAVPSYKDKIAQGMSASGRAAAQAKPVYTAPVVRSTKSSSSRMISGMSSSGRASSASKRR